MSICSARANSALAGSLREKAAAEFLGVSVHLIRKWRLYGGGPKATKLGRVVVYRFTDLQDFLDAAATRKAGR